MSGANSDKFQGTDSEARSFCRWLKLYREGKLKPTNGASKRERKPGFPEVEEALVDYIELRMKKFQQDKLGISWQIMKDKGTSLTHIFQPTICLENNGELENMFWKIIRS